VLSKLSRFIERHLQTGDASVGLSDDQKQLAFVSLLIEVAMADHHFSDSEHQNLVDAIERKFNLPNTIILELVESAKQESANSTSLHPFTQLIHNHCTSQEKFDLIKAMWELAYADGVLDKHEDYIIRKLADLIYVPHTEFIRARNFVKNSL
jgi:uncharacterized tellurite resistance protein B-like protein